MKPSYPILLLLVVCLILFPIETIVGLTLANLIGIITRNTVGRG